MGGDGGSIPGRADLVRTKQKPQQKDRQSVLDSKWYRCHLSQESLRPPICACELGRLFNREAILEFLLDRGKFSCADAFSHIQTLKDVHTLTLTPNPEHDRHSRRQMAEAAAAYICPVTGTEMNGLHRFCYLRSCGCVFSERALAELSPGSTGCCNLCGRAFSAAEIIPLNPDSEQQQQTLRARMLERKRLSKKQKITKRKLDPVEVPPASSHRTGEQQTGTERSASTSSNTADSSTGTTGSSTSEPAASTTRPSGGGGGGGGKAGGDGRSVAAAGATVMKKQRREAAASTRTAAAPPPPPPLHQHSSSSSSLQDDPSTSAVFKSLFTSSAGARRREAAGRSAHWVTYNPQYY